MHPLITKAKRAVSRLKTSEVADALVATWCVEYLRARRLGGFNVVEMMAISLLMLSIKAIVLEANRRHHNGKNRTVVVSSWDTQVGEMGLSPDSTRTYPEYRRYVHGRARFRQRQPGHRNPHKDV